MKERSAASRAPAWVGLATVLHAAALAGLLLMPMRRGHDPVSGRPADPVEIAVVVEEDPSPSPSEPRAGTAAEPSRSASHVATTAGATTAGATSAGPSGASSSEPMDVLSTTEAPPSSTGGVVPIPLSSAQLGLGGIGATNPFLPRAEEKVPTTGPDTPGARAMRGTGLAHDRELGLGPEGPVVRALSEATSSSVAPLRGRAVFIVRSGGDGLVIGVDVVDAAGGSGWSDAGRIALESLRGKKLVVPRGANGMSMRIEITSDMKLPNGESAPFGVRSGVGNSPELTMPDVSNLGSKPRRIVHSRVVSTELL